MLYVSKEIETGPPNFPENIYTPSDMVISISYPSYIQKGIR